MNDRLRVASFNVLADEYLRNGDYSQVDPALLKRGARTLGLVAIINNLEADVVGLQEVEEPLVDALLQYSQWEGYYVQKSKKVDGCLTLVRSDAPVDDYEQFTYTDGSGHVGQVLTVGGVAVANTHIRWAPVDDPQHVGVRQTRELLGHIPQHKAVILADCNDRPGGPVRELVTDAGFTNTCDGEYTAIVNGVPAELDLAAVRGLKYSHRHSRQDIYSIPSAALPSDHLPVFTDIYL
jgi:mRNA deadenylase 3'-5' endonuclease subunit Ccr4